MRFEADEFVVGSIWGSLSGECQMGFDGFPELVSIDWQSAQFSRTADPCGEPVVLSAADKELIETAIDEAFGRVVDAGFDASVVIHSVQAVG